MNVLYKMHQRTGRRFDAPRWQRPGVGLGHHCPRWRYGSRYGTGGESQSLLSVGNSGEFSCSGQMSRDAGLRPKQISREHEMHLRKIFPKKDAASLRRELLEKLSRVSPEEFGLDISLSSTSIET